MIEISEPLEGSKLGLTTTHDILQEGERIGYVDVNYIQANEVKSLRKYSKRKLSVGQPYSVHVFIDLGTGKASAKLLGKEDLHMIIVALKEKFKKLEARDIFILELGSKGKTIIGRGSEYSE